LILSAQTRDSSSSSTGWGSINGLRARERGDPVQGEPEHHEPQGEEADAGAAHLEALTEGRQQEHRREHHGDAHVLVAGGR
jgi:hypothetical protein